MDFKLLKEKKYLDLLKENRQVLHDAKVMVKVEHPGILEVPEGKDVEDLSLDHFKGLAKKKGYAAISRALTNLHRWNVKKDPKLSSWADKMQDRLGAWVEKERKAKGDENLYEK